MRIECPSCNAAYHVPDPVVEARRTLRCSRCGTDFAARAAEAVAPPPPQAAPGETLRVSGAERFTLPPEPVPAAAQPARLVLAAWALSLLVIAASGWAAIAWRAPIMRAWPPSTRVYAALGYPL